MRAIIISDKGGLSYSMQATICKTCEKSFTPKSSSKGIFCSYECYWNSKKRRKEYVCEICGGQVSPVKSVKKCFTCASRARRGNKHFNWKGALVGYSALHSWVRRELGTPNKCECCGTTGEGHSMHWANISGEYKSDLS